MAKNQILNRESLESHLTVLKGEREKYEIIITGRLERFYSDLENPVPYIKKKIDELAADQELRNNLIKIGINAAAKFVLKKQTQSTSGKESILKQIINKFAAGNDQGDAVDIAQIVKRLFKLK